jgi:hypothetical protein
MSASFEAYQHALGIRSLSFYRPPTSMSQTFSNDAFSSEQLMAVGSYDGKVRLLSMRSWQVYFIELTSIFVRSVFDPISLRRSHLFTNTLTRCIKISLFHPKFKIKSLI